MPCCCCKTNVKAAFIIGIFLMILSLFPCLLAFLISDKDNLYLQKVVSLIATCISTALAHGILVYGADKRNRSAILIWIVLQIIGLVVVTIIIIFHCIFLIKQLPEGDGFWVIIHIYMKFSKAYNQQNTY